MWRHQYCGHVSAKLRFSLLQVVVFCFWPLFLFSFFLTHCVTPPLKRCFFLRLMRMHQPHVYLSVKLLDRHLFDGFLYLSRMAISMSVLWMWFWLKQSQQGFMWKQNQTLTSPPQISACQRLRWPLTFCSAQFFCSGTIGIRSTSHAHVCTGGLQFQIK